MAAKPWEEFRQWRAGLPFMSQSSLSAVIDRVRKQGLPGCATSARSIRRNRDAMIGEIGPYGPLHKKVPMAGNLQLEVQDPAAMLARVAATPGLRGLLHRARSFPPPWHLVLYSDEVSPGNPLGYIGGRKTWAVYWSVLEFGQAALSSEDAFGSHKCVHSSCFSTIVRA